MADFPGWTFDPNRNEYYYYSAREECWIYQSGQRIHASGATTASGGSANQEKKDPKKPRTNPRRRDVQSAIENAGNEDSDESLTDKLGALDLAGAGWVDGRHGTGERVTDPELVKIGVRSQGLLKGNYAPKNYQKLHPEFKTRKPGKKFFIRGKVFKALWPETLGDNNESVTTTRDSKFGENIATKIRWFVVVKEGHHFCTCLPIVTYNRRGVAKPGVVKENHAIAFSSAYEPLPEPSEMPRVGESPMLPGIRIRPKSKRDKLDKMARIDFARMYTVEHKIKAYYFGDVESESLETLITQWVRIIAQEVTEGLLPFATTKSTTRLRTNDNVSDEEEDSDEEEAEDDYDNPSNDEEEEEEEEEGSDDERAARTRPSQTGYGYGGSSRYSTTTDTTAPTSSGYTANQYGYGAGGYGGAYPQHQNYAPSYPPSDYPPETGKSSKSGKSKESKSSKSGRRT